MFTEILEYKQTLDKIVEHMNLTSQQTNNLIKVITENPNLSPDEFYEVARAIGKNEKLIFDGYVEYAFDPILNENTQVNLLEIVIPIIRKHIPDAIITRLTEKHATDMINSIMEVEFTEHDTVQSLTSRIDEMFTAGNISIPAQGFRTDPTTLEIVINGVFAPRLYKGIQFGKKFHTQSKCENIENKSTLRDALKGYKMLDRSTPIGMLLPQIVVTLKQLLGK